MNKFQVHIITTKDEHRVISLYNRHLAIDHILAIIGCYAKTAWITIERG